MKKITRIVLALLFCIGFFFPYISGTIVSIGNYKYSAFQLESLNPAKSADLFVLFYYLFVLIFIVLLFSYPKFTRIFNLTILTLGLIGAIYINIEIFSDPGLKLAISQDQMTAHLGFGIIYQVIIYGLAILYEFTEKNIYSKISKTM